ncbi:MAG: RNA pyrophosphohydrolase [Alphaproteobacteria bacterium]|jgi:putative (di)nucleoside polyphosphate hydrolase
MPRFEDLPYRPCVGVVLFNRAGLVFAGRRLGGSPEHVDADHRWQMPQGGIDAGEDPLAAAKRELFEETNVRTATLLAEAPEWFAYDLPQDVAGQAWKGRYRGQTQKWFAFRFEGDDSEINIHAPGGGEKPEFEAWRWEHLARMPDLIIPFKRGVYELVAKTFAPFSR